MTKTMFSMGFSAGSFRPHPLQLGQDSWSSLVNAGASIYSQINQADVAKDLKKAQENAARAAAANAQAAQANATTAAIQNPTIMGMNQSTVIIGGIALIALVGIAAMLKSKPEAGRAA